MGTGLSSNYLSTCVPVYPMLTIHGYWSILQLPIYSCTCVSNVNYTWVLVYPSTILSTCVPVYPMLTIHGYWPSLASFPPTTRGSIIDLTNYHIKNKTLKLKVFSKECVCAVIRVSGHTLQFAYAYLRIFLKKKKYLTFHMSLENSDGLNLQYS